MSENKYDINDGLVGGSGATQPAPSQSKYDINDGLTQNTPAPNNDNRTEANTEHKGPLDVANEFYQSDPNASVPRKIVNSLGRTAVGIPNTINAIVSPPKNQEEDAVASAGGGAGQTALAAHRLLVQPAEQAWQHAHDTSEQMRNSVNQQLLQGKITQPRAEELHKHIGQFEKAYKLVSAMFPMYTHLGEMYGKGDKAGAVTDLGTQVAMAALGAKAPIGEGAEAGEAAANTGRAAETATAREFAPNAPGAQEAGHAVQSEVANRIQTREGALGNVKKALHDSVGTTETGGEEGIKNNASGQTDVSHEANAVVKSEQNKGIQTVRIRQNGQEVPLKGINSRDVPTIKGETVVKRYPDGHEEIVNQGEGANYKAKSAGPGDGASAQPYSGPSKKMGDTVERRAANGMGTRERIDTLNMAIKQAKEAGQNDLAQQWTQMRDETITKAQSQNRAPVNGNGTSKLETPEAQTSTATAEPEVTVEPSEEEKAQIAPNAMPYPKNSQASKAGNDILNEMHSSKLEDIPDDPISKRLQGMSQQFIKGADKDGSPLAYTPEELDQEYKNVSNFVEDVKKNGTASQISQAKRLAKAVNDDRYAMYSEHGDPQLSQRMRDLSSEVRDLHENYNEGPASAFYKAAETSPEKLITKITSGGKNAQSAVEDMMDHLSPQGKETLKQSVWESLMKDNKLPDGTVDMSKVADRFNKMEDTANSLYGEKQAGRMRDYLKAANEAQIKKQAIAQQAAGKGSKVAKVGKDLTKAAGGFVGAKVANVPGAIVGHGIGEALGDIIFDDSPSGAVRVGIHPEENIVLTPAEKMKFLPQVSNFLKAKNVGNFAAMATAYGQLSSAVEGGRKGKEGVK